jgi:nitrogen regulatory protein PII-like uncharacterized protein
MAKTILFIIATLVVGLFITSYPVSASQARTKKLIYSQEDMDKKIAEVQKAANERVATAEKAASEKIAAIEKAVDEKVSAANQAADDRIKANEDESAKRNADVVKAAEEKIKKVLAESASAEYMPFLGKAGTWYTVENSNSQMRYRDPIWKDMGNAFSVEIDIPDRRIGAKDDDRVTTADLSFYVVTYDKDKKAMRRTTVVLRDVPRTGGRFSLLAPLFIDQPTEFCNVYYNGVLPINNDRN